MQERRRRRIRSSRGMDNSNRWAKGGMWYPLQFRRQFWERAVWIGSDEEKRRFSNPSSPFARFLLPSLVWFLVIKWGYPLLYCFSSPILHWPCFVCCSSRLFFHIDDVPTPIPIISIYSIILLLRHPPIHSTKTDLPEYSLLYPTSSFLVTHFCFHFQLDWTTRTFSLLIYLPSSFWLFWPDRNSNNGNDVFRFITSVNSNINITYLSLLWYGGFRVSWRWYVCFLASMVSYFFKPLFSLVGLLLSSRTYPNNFAYCIHHRSLMFMVFP